jgi:hypothetical protein
MEAWPWPRRGEWPGAGPVTAAPTAGGCVGVASGPGTVAVRDSKDPEGPRLAFTAGDWRAFLRQVMDGQLA